MKMMMKIKVLVVHGPYNLQDLMNICNRTTHVDTFLPV